MIELIKYEIKKVFSPKLFLLFSILLFLNGIKIYSDYSYTDSVTLKNGYIKIYEQIRGQINNEKISFLSNEYLKNKRKVDMGDYNTENIDPDTYSGYVFGDMNLFYDFLQDYYSFIDYQLHAEEIIRTAEENILLYDNHSQMDQYIVNNFQNRKITYYYNTEGYSSLYDYEFSTFLCLLVSLFCSILLFCNDEEKQIDLIYTTPLGKKKILGIKILSAFLFSFFLSAIFYFEDFIIFSNVMIVDGALNPIYSLSDFSSTFMNCSIVAGYLLLCLIRFIGIWVITSICIFFSILKPKALFSFLFSFILLSLLIILPADYWNPISFFLIQNKWANCEFINFLDFSFLNYELSYLFMLLEAVTIFISLYFVIKKGLYERTNPMGIQKSNQK